MECIVHRASREAHLLRVLIVQPSFNMPEITTLYGTLWPIKIDDSSSKVYYCQQCVVFIVVKDVHERVWEHYNQDCGADSLDREGIVSL